MNDGYFEKVTQFGPERGMVGVLTVPVKLREDAPHVLLLNSGIIHRVVTNRISVQLARSLARLGISSLRFDLSGIGDSERRRDVTSLQEAVERDIADAMSFLGAHAGARCCVLIGLCSGAYDALHAALADERIVGTVLVDLPGPFRYRGHTLHHLRRRLLRPASWRNSFNKARHYFREFVFPAAPRPHDQKYVVGARSIASREWMDEHLASLLSRNVRMYFIFTGGIESNYNHDSQFRNVFPKVALHSAVRHAFFAEADHAFSRSADRARLVNEVLSWMKHGWLAGSAASIREAAEPLDIASRP